MEKNLGNDIPEAPKLTEAELDAELEIEISAIEALGTQRMQEIAEGKFAAQYFEDLGERTQNFVDSSGVSMREVLRGVEPNHFSQVAAMLRQGMQVRPPVSRPVRGEF